MSHIILLLLIIYSNISLAIDTITLNQGHADPISIAINDFEANNSSENVIGKNIVKVISIDLKQSGFFYPISPIVFIEKKIGVNHKPLFAAWRQVNGNLLLNGQIEKVSSKKFKVSFVLWDSVLGERYNCIGA